MLMLASLFTEVSCPVAVGLVATPDNTRDLQTTTQALPHLSPSLVCKSLRSYVKDQYMIIVVHISVCESSEDVIVCVDVIDIVASVAVVTNDCLWCRVNQQKPRKHLAHTQVLFCMPSAVPSEHCMTMHTSVTLC